MKTVSKGKSIQVSIDGLNKLFNHRTRMGIMAILMVNEWVEFVTLRDTLKVTDGSLASHLKALNKAGLVTIEKKFVDHKPQTSYQTTPLGRTTFNQHLEELEAFVKLRDNLS